MVNTNINCLPSEYNDYNFTPCEIVTFNKLLKTMDITNKKNMHQKKQLYVKPTLKRSETVSFFENNYNTQNKHHEQPSKIVDVTINSEINNISDLINLIETYKLDNNIRYNIDMKSLHSIKEPLIELNNMIGMKQLKSNIVYQILYFIQELNKNSDEFMHTVIYDLLVRVKLKLLRLLAKFFQKLGFYLKVHLKRLQEAI